MKEREQLVVKNNSFIQEYRHSLSAQEQRLVLYLISKISKDDEEFKEYEIKVPDFCRICGIDPSSGGNYKVLKASLKGLADKSVWTRLPNGKITTVRWIEEPVMDDIETFPELRSTGTVQVKLNKNMMPFLLKLNYNFTSYSLIYTLNMTSRYSTRLFELLRSYHYNKTKPYEVLLDIDDLKEKLDAVKKTYVNFKDFRTAVLKKSIDEINEYTDMDVTYEPIKSGRKVTSIKFLLKTKDAMDRVELYEKLEAVLNGDGGTK